MGKKGLRKKKKAFCEMDDCFLHLIGLSLRYVVGDILLKEKHFQNESYKERMERKEVRVVAK